MKDDELVALIKSAIKVGAPLFNNGDKQGCYKTYLKIARDGGNQATSKTAQDLLQRAIQESEQVLAKDEQEFGEAAWALRRGFDKVKELIKDDELVTLIKSAIKVGAPLFNNGDKKGCYKTYLKVTQDGEDQAASKTAQDFLRQALQESEQVLAKDKKEFGEAAWALRRGFDKVKIFVKEKSTIEPMKRRQTILEEAMLDLIDHPKLGILRLDYDYPAALGDIDNPQSFGYPVVYRVVPGLTFQMAQEGTLSPEVEEEFRLAIEFLADEKKVTAISGDCGFMFWFEDKARRYTKIPVLLSALMQLPTISATQSCRNDRHDQIIVLTANSTSLRPMQNLINTVTGNVHYVYVGCEDVPHFGYEVENGLAIDVVKAAPGIFRKVQEAIAAQDGTVRAILCECTELPPYSDMLRARTGLPVYDSITNCDFVMNAFLDNERFGEERWYKEWDGSQEHYQFGQFLSAEQRSKLVSKPVDEQDMHMIVKKLRTTSLFAELEEMGLRITAEEAAQAIAEQVELNQIAVNMEEMSKKAKKDKKKFMRVRELFSYSTK